MTREALKLRLFIPLRDFSAELERKILEPV